jgi:hypothetical protein
MMLDILKVVAVFLGIIFCSYTIPRLITFAICTSYYEAKLKHFELLIKKARKLNETK